MKREIKDPNAAKLAIKQEVNMTLQFFVDSDMKFYGRVTEETKAAIKKQRQTLNEETNQVIL